jgi:hypothetical protein
MILFFDVTLMYVFTVKIQQNSTIEYLILQLHSNHFFSNQKATRL